MKAAFHTLGCKVNFYETEALKEGFISRGYEIVGEEEFADVYVVNTCTVTAIADRKSRQYIRRMKRLNPKSIIAVCGCYSQTNAEDIAKIPDIDILMGTKEKMLILDYVEQFKQNPQRIVDVRNYKELVGYDETGSIISMENRNRAFVKVQEGCNRFCAYCEIPYARGQVRSRAPKAVLDEVEGLISKGFKEIVLTGINTALYGNEDGFAEKYADDPILKESGDAYGIEILIKAIDELDGEFRVRLSSLEPTVINVEYVKRLFKYKRLCHHLHLSAQSGSDSVLKNMNRHYDRAEYLEIVKALYEFDPHYGISTDIIVGFPMESDEDFADSVKLCDEVKFCKVHVFKYSRRPGTVAAKMEGQVKPEIKNARSDVLIEAGDKASAYFCKSQIGTVRELLIEEKDAKSGLFTGYLDNYTKAYLKSDEMCYNGLVKVKITEECLDGVLVELA